MRWLKEFVSRLRVTPRSPAKPTENEERGIDIEKYLAAGRVTFWRRQIAIMQADAEDSLVARRHGDLNPAIVPLLRRK